MAKVINFGCRVNAYESEIIKKNSEDLDESYVILNSCAVTNEAEKDLLQQIKKIQKNDPSTKVILTGCAAQINPEKYAGLVHFVVGNVEKLQENTFRNIANNSVQSKFEQQSSTKHEDKIFMQSKPTPKANNLLIGDIMNAQNFKQEEIIEFQSTRAIVQVQNGCNHRCTFCIIPFGRGNSRSVPAGGVVSSIKNLVEKGYKEVVLTGIDLTDYGKDLPSQPTLSHLVHRILKNVPNLPRLRLSSIDVAEMDSDMFKILANEERFMPYFHLSLQSGDNMILKRMKRRHTREQILEFHQKALQIRKNIGFGADIIAGFPTETDKQFENSLHIIKECNIAFGHIFPFSAKTGTPAAKMPQIPMKIRKERAKILREESAKQMEILLQNMRGTSQKVLVEKGSKGHCENFTCVDVPSQNEVNSIVEVIL
ncbi:MAG: tRNA (N(6)-L-threonylcarbamoyladenosine(37)-C(2))-methylthiotransferase MtaB [Proteobacteria bacterium]|nr:tRNA (N(6)-L-threonylcarbamoyladenosine(37)-C(2))-methylthiotransferase MtaB [Pseudomonadota bacterium]